MFAGCFLFIFLAAGFALSNSLFFLFALFSLLSLATALFFVGFQLFMGEGANLPVYKSTAFYTLAWSLGIAFGFLVQGVLEDMGPLVSLLPAAAGSLLVLGGLWIVERSSLAVDASGKDEGVVPGFKNRVSPQLEKSFLLVGWVNILTASALGMGIRFLIPKIAIARFGFSPAASGLLLFFSLALQGLFGFLLMKFSGWLYKLKPHFCLEIISLLGCLVAAAMPDIRGLILMALSIGIYNGHAFYNGVFYSLSHREKSGRNICINEALGGVSALAGPLIAGAALQAGIRNFFFIPPILIGTSLAIQLLITKFKSR